MPVIVVVNVIPLISSSRYNETECV